MTLNEMPNNEVANANSEKNQSNAGRDALHGVTVPDLNSDSRSALNIPANIQGALITEVDPASR